MPPEKLAMRVLGRPWTHVAHPAEVWSDRLLVAYAALGSLGFLAAVVLGDSGTGLFFASALVLLCALTVAAGAATALLRLVARRRLTGVGSDHVMVGKRRIGREDIRGAWVLSTLQGQVLELELRNGRVVRAADPKHLLIDHDVLAVLGVQGPAARYQINDTYAWPNAPLFFYPLVAFLASCPGYMFAKVVPAQVAVILTGLLVMLVYAALLRSGGPKVMRVGADGVGFTRFWRERYVPYDAIQGVSTIPGGIELTLRDGTTERMQVARVQVRDLIIASIHEAMAALPPVPEGVPALDRGGRSVNEWRAEVMAMARGQGYRAAALSVDDARALARDPRVRVDQRVGAAIVLKEAGELGTLRVAAAEEPSPTLRRALEGLAEGDLADEVLEKAVR